MGLASLFVRFACLPDERHITGPRCRIAIVDTDRVYAGRLDLHVVGDVDVHDVGSRYATASCGDGRGEFDSKPTQSMKVLGICNKLT